MGTLENPRFRVKHQGPSPVRSGVVERLVSEGRIPVLDEVIVYAPRYPDYPYGETSRRVSHCWVPSSDTRRGDTTWKFYGVRHFQSPSGGKRTPSDMFILRPFQARRVQERIDAALASSTG